MKKNASPYCGDRYRSHDVQRSHSPVKLKPLEAGRRRSWFQCFLEVAGAVCCGCVLWEVFTVYVCSVSRYGTILLICWFFVGFSLVLLFENDSA